MEDEENRLLERRSELVETYIRTTMIVLATGSMLAFAVVTLAVMFINREMAERQQAEESVRLYQDIVQNVSIGVTIWRLEHRDDCRSLRLLSFNPAAAHLLGMDLQQCLGETITEAFPAVDAKQLELYAEVARTGRARDAGEVRYGDDRVAENIWSVKAFPLPRDAVGLAFENVTERQRAEEKIKCLNEELEQRVAERTAELAEANRELSHRNQENEMFVYSVSHDLRSPLVNLQGFSKELGVVCGELGSLLAGQHVPAEVQQRGRTILEGEMKESIHFIQTAVMRLSGIIDALLRLSRAGRVEYQPKAVDLNATFRRIVDASQAGISACGANVVLTDMLPAWGDPTALEQVFANLIGNALNYLDPKRPGLIEAGNLHAAFPSSEPGWRTYYVKDNGQGIPEAYRAKVFQPLQRLHPEAARGEGMGLAIVKRIVERHRGKVWFESTQGSGTTFFVALPVVPGTE